MQRGSYGTVRVEYAVPRKKVERALARYVKKLRSKIQLHQAVLFGSYARDDYSHGSDIDLAIVAEGLPENHAERYALVKDSILGLDLEPFAYTTDEWNQMLRTRSTFAKEIMKHGKVIYRAL